MARDSEYAGRITSGVIERSTTESYEVSPLLDTNARFMITDVRLMTDIRDIRLTGPIGVERDELCPVGVALIAMVATCDCRALPWSRSRTPPATRCSGTQRGYRVGEPVSSTRPVPV